MEGSLISGLGGRLRKALLDCKRSEARQASIVANWLDAAVVMDADGRVVEWHRQAEQVFGWTRDEAIGQGLGRSCSVPPQHPRVTARRGPATLLDHGQGIDLDGAAEFPAVRRDGSELDVESTFSQIRIGGNRVSRGAFSRHFAPQAPRGTLAPAFDGIAAAAPGDDAF